MEEEIENIAVLSKASFWLAFTTLILGIVFGWFSHKYIPSLLLKDTDVRISSLFNEVHLIFITPTPAQAKELQLYVTEGLVMGKGTVTLSAKGKPTK
jgi:hypothetical protein